MTIAAPKSVVQRIPPAQVAGLKRNDQRVDVIDTSVNHLLQYQYQFQLRFENLSYRIQQ